MSKYDLSDRNAVSGLIVEFQGEDQWVMAEDKTVFIGRHEHRFQYPNRLYIFMRGTIDAQEIEAQNKFIRDCSGETGRLIRNICNLDEFEGMTTDARRHIVKMNHEYPYVGMAFVGGSFMSRTVAATVLRAARHLVPQHFTFPLYFGKTIEECEAWMDQQPDPSAK